MALINALANSMPVANQKAANQRKAAADLQLQQAVASTPATAPVTQTAQTLGAAAQQTVGGAQVAQAEQAVGQQASLGQTAIQNKATEIQNKLTNVKQGMAATQLSDEDRFATLSSQAKAEMFDSRKKFATDEMGRKFMNERQLADYAKSSAKDDAALQKWASKSQQAHKRNLQVLEQGQRIIEMKLKQQSALSEQQKDQALTKELTEAKKAMDQRIAQAKADAANSSGIWATAGTVVGGVVGGIYGGPVGASAGATAGGALGAGIASQTQEEV